MAAFDPVAAGFTPYSPPAQQATPATPGQGAAPPAPTIPGQVFTGPGPAAAQAMATGGLQAAQGFQAISDQGVKARAQDALLANMQNDLAQFTSGSNAENELGWKRFIQSWSAPLGLTFGIDPTKIAAQESYQKIVNMLADAQGAGSDARLAVNQGANPSEHLSPEGASLITNQLRGNAAYTMARSQLAAHYPDQLNLPAFESDIGAKLNPQVFQVNRMTGPQKTAYYTNMDPRDRPGFQANYGYANHNGVLGIPNGGQ